MTNSLTEHVIHETLTYLENMPKNIRKEIGQFFTSAETARYMASMFSIPQKEELSILDPGAGSGILTAAVIDRLQEYPEKCIHIICYETSESVLPILKNNLEYVKANSVIPVSFEIKEENYITSQKDDFNRAESAEGISPKYDWIISNPPYKKISSNAPEALCMSHICYGAPNMYFLFAAMGLFNLESDGEMVFIIPRSWTSGAYFRRFRDYLFGNGTLKQVHLFVKRDKVFDQEQVLQETIIIKVDKSKAKDAIRITCSNSNLDFDNIHTIDVPYDAVVAGPEKYVYLITQDEELKVLKSLHKWKSILSSIGLKMRTGLTVDFRNRGYLRNEKEDGTVPLLYAHHMKNGRVEFPSGKQYEYITTEKAGLLQKNKNYLLVKRFTSKEEARRFQSAIYLASDLPEYDQISTDNKVNFIEGKDFDMTPEQVYGLYVIFNSTLYDQYYRILNGSTQVNATETNVMPTPSLTEIEKLGAALMQKNDLSVSICDKLLGALINEKNG